MPVRVSIPTTIRIDHASLREHPEWLEEAFAAAVGRALENSRNLVIDRRGGYFGVRPHAPEFRWRGVSVRHEERTALEASVNDLLGQLLAKHGIFPSRRLTDTARVLPSDPSEPYDESRGSRILGRYLVDGYDGGQADLSAAELKGSPLFEFVDVVKVLSTVDDPEAIDKFNELALDATLDQPLGILFRYSAPGSPEGWQVVVSDGTPGFAGAFHFAAFKSLHFQGEKSSPKFELRSYVPSVGASTAEIIDLPTDREGRRDVYKQLFGDVVGQAIRRQTPKKVSMTTAKYNSLIDQLVADGIDEGVQGIGSVTKAIRITLSQATMILWMTADQQSNLRWKGVARLTPITDREVHLKKDKRGGEPGGSGSEHKLRFKSDGSGSSNCPGDEVPREQWGGLNDEPAVDELGDAGILFQKFITQIATEVGIPESKWAGQFCVDAGKKLIDLAHATQSMVETTSGQNKAADGDGNMGPLNFDAGESPIIARVRQLAGYCADIAELTRTIGDTFMDKDYACAIHGIYRGNGSGWTLHLLEEVMPVLRDVVYELFVSGCRSCLLQLLLTSMKEIEKRQAAMNRYAPLFEQWIVPQIMEIGELTTLDKNLRNYQATKAIRQAQKDQRNVLATAVQSAAGVQLGSNWLHSTAQLVSSITGSALVKSVGLAYEVVDDGGVDKVRDSKGNLWAKDDLDQAIALKSNTAMGIDPLFKQITDTPDAMKRFKNSTSIRTELENLLKEMFDDNFEMQVKAHNDAMFAFGATSRSENIPHATIEGGKYALQGIHKITHDQIGDAFKGHRIYAAGVDYLFDSEEGKASLEGFGLMVGLIALSILVPGGAFLAFGVGVAVATNELGNAYEKKRLYRALIDPEKVLDWSEVEVGLFVAWFGFVLSLVPEAGTATKALVSGGRAVAKGEAKTITKLAASAIAKRTAEAFTEYAVRDLLEAFLKEAAVNLVMSQLIEQLMTPIIEQIQADAALGTTVREDPDAEMNRFISKILVGKGTN